MRLKNFSAANFVKILILAAFLQADSAVVRYSLDREKNTVTLCQKLLGELGVKSEEIANLDSLEKINEFLQKNFLRKNERRFQEVANPGDAEKIQKILPILAEFGMIGEAKPTKNDPDYLVILGATVGTMRNRAQYALNLMSNEVKVLMDKNSTELAPKQVVILTSKRPLDQNCENDYVLFDLQWIRAGWFAEKRPENEAQAAAFVWDQLPKSSAIDRLKFEVISTNGSEGTFETVEFFLKELKKLGKKGQYIVFVSSNPYVPYQNQVIEEAVLKADFDGEFETVGGELTNENTKLSVLLDNIARYVYAMVQVKKMLETKKTA